MTHRQALTEQKIEAFPREVSLFLGLLASDQNRDHSASEHSILITAENVKPKVN